MITNRIAIMNAPQKIRLGLESSAPIQSSTIKLSALMLAAFGFVATLLNAEVVTQVRSLDAGVHWNQSTTGGQPIWSDGNAASGANDYVNSGYTLRTTTGSSTFNGNSLTIQSGGQLLLKPNSANQTYTINNLILDGGTINHGQPSITNAYIAGSITLLSDSNFISNASSYRRSTITASVSGSSVFNVSLGASDALTIGSSSNAFNGEWRVNQHNGETPMGFFATGNGSLGNADVFIDTGIAFDVDYDINNSTKSLVMNGIMTLDQDHTFGIVQIDGDTLAAGTYSFADLNTAYDAFFADGGTGSLTVVPEPGSFALVSGMLALTWVALGRRRLK